MIGDAKALLAGSDLGLEDVMAVEIGDERVVSIGEARRRAIEELDIVVYATLTNPDRDLVPLAEPGAINLQLGIAGAAGDLTAPEPFGPVGVIPPQ